MKHQKFNWIWTSVQWGTFCFYFVHLLGKPRSQFYQMPLNHNLSKKFTSSSSWQEGLFQTYYAFGLVLTVKWCHWIKICVRSLVALCSRLAAVGKKFLCLLPSSHLYKDNFTFGLVFTMNWGQHWITICLRISVDLVAVGKERLLPSSQFWLLDAAVSKKLPLRLLPSSPSVVSWRQTRPTSGTSYYPDFCLPSLALESESRKFHVTMYNFLCLCEFTRENRSHANFAAILLCMQMWTSPLLPTLLCEFYHQLSRATMKMQHFAEVNIHFFFQDLSVGISCKYHSAWYSNTYICNQI